MRYLRPGLLLCSFLVVLLGATLLAAAALKLADPTGTALAAATFGLGDAAARHAWLALAALEAGLAVGLLAVGLLAVGLLRRGRADLVELGRARGAAHRGRDGAGDRLGPGHRAAARSARARRDRARRRDRPACTHRAAHRCARRPGRRPGARHPLALGGGVRLALFTAPGCRLCRALRYPGGKPPKFPDCVPEGVAVTLWSTPLAPNAAYVSRLRRTADGTSNTILRLAR